MASSGDNSLRVPRPRMPLVPMIRIALAGYLWFPLARMLYLYQHSSMPMTAAMMLDYGKWLAGWNDRFILHFFGAVYAPCEMRAYASRAQDANHKHLAETCLGRSSTVLAVWLLSSEAYFAVNLSWTLPVVPWFLLISNYVLILAVVAVACASVVRDLDGASFLARMVLLFPARQLLPWSSAKDIFYYVTGQHELMENEAWVDAKKREASETKVTPPRDSSTEGKLPLSDGVIFRLFGPVFSVLMALRFWAYWLPLSSFSSWSPFSLLDIQLVAQAAQFVAYIPWPLTAGSLAFLVDRQTDVAAVKTALNKSATDSLLLLWALILAQVIYLHDEGGPAAVHYRFRNVCVIHFQLGCGVLPFLLRLYQSKVSRDEWLLAGRLLLRMPDMLLFPRLQATSLYSYFRGHHHLVPEAMLSVEQKAELQRTDAGQGLDEEKQQMLLAEQLNSV